MKKICITLAVSCFSMLLLQAQHMSRITGTVKSGEKAIEAATVTLLMAKDSAVIKIEVTDKNGKFELLSSGEGRFLLLISAVGFENKYTAPFTVSSASQTIQTGTTDIAIQSRDMKAVVITVKKPLIEQKIDKLVVNVDAAPTNAGATAMEVLEKSPGITVDNDGNISLKGKAGVIVMMDGKPTYLSAADLANLLKNTPASAINQIEIMSNPSSKYDAAGNSGIINIKTKKSLKTGLNGSIMLGASAGFFSKNDVLYVQPKLQHSLNFNYRKNKINIFGNYNPNFNKRKNELTILRKFYNEDGTLNASAALNTAFNGKGDNHSAKLGADYYINNKNVLGVVFTGFGFFGDFAPSTISNIYNPDGSLQSGLHSATDNNIKFRNYTGNINYKHSFDSLGREFTIDVDYVKYDNVSEMLLTTNATDKLGNTLGDPILLKGHLPSNIDIYSFKSDYVHPFKKDFKIEAGIKVNYVKNNNIVNYTRYDGEEWANDFRSNHFIYEENINAAYININKKLSERWNAQAGLRAENTNTKGYQVTNDSAFKRHYTNLFPTAFVSYAINKNNQLTLSYSRRVNRPNYQDLNPFIYFLDSLTYQKGNPYLLPQFSHNMELSHSFRGKFITTLNYSKTTDVISQILRQNTDEKTTFQTTENVSEFRNIGLAVTAPFKWTPWFNTSIFLNLYNNQYKGIYNGSPIDASNTAYMVNLTHSFTFARGFSAELSGFYRSEGLNGLLVMNEMYQMSIGLQKNIMEGKSTLRLNIRDPFGWQKFGGYMKYGDVDVTVKNRWDTRQVTASFTWRFGKNTIAPSRKRATGVSDEINRAGQAN
ncbi:TonB-dependent receptor domain-containing protein [Agriterribacter sp.]|uniref:TonB-dependent receptor domain-containing protein n=1 Tax=Agriterribacter sp. TaxID=2821509 RepID=UPI002B5B3788|nr:TonB-dependent receptor [Agriterribacter sp.]HTN07470.1 TonB-dependent receptor [Agriterribacter sp.]